MPTAVERWRALPAAARWPLLFLALFALGALVGHITPLGVGNGVFATGIGVIAVSLTYVRLGGARTRIGRDLDGKPLWGIDAKLRNKELKRGLYLFSLGLALWAALLALFVAGVVL